MSIFPGCSHPWRAFMECPECENLSRLREMVATIRCRGGVHLSAQVFRMEYIDAEHIRLTPVGEK